jgi:predicted deacylase
VIDGRPEDGLARRVGRVRIDKGTEGVKPPPVLSHATGAGPVVAVIANVHGDEVTGTIAIHELDRWLPEHLTRGTVHLYPSVNPIGLVARTRGVGADGGDLNRAFPGDAAGTVSERLASALWRDLEERGVDVLIDLHADAASAIPYAIVDRPIALKGDKAAELQKQLVACAEATGLTVLRDYPVDQYKRYRLDRSLAGAWVNRAGKVAVTVEAGPRRIVDGDAVHATAEAVRGVLNHQRMVDVRPEPHRTRVPGLWCRSTSARTKHDGLFVPALAPGIVFTTGDRLGAVRSVTGEVLDEIVAATRGLAVSWPEASWTPSGSSIGTFGVEEP